MTTQELFEAIYQTNVDENDACTEPPAMGSRCRREKTLSAGADSVASLVTLPPQQWNCPPLESPRTVGHFESKKGIVEKVFHSFKQAKSDVSCVDVEGGFPCVPDASPLHRKLKGRHLQMIAIGAINSAGLFVGSGRALAEGGPGSLLLGFGVLGVMLFCMVNALAELGSAFPLQGATTILRNSDKRILFNILWTVYRSSLGIRHGLELCPTMDRYISCRTHRRRTNHTILES